MKTQTIAKPSFTKSKAYGLCGTLALATALLIGAGQVSADETTQPVVDAQPAVFYRILVRKRASCQLLVSWLSPQVSLV